MTDGPKVPERCAGKPVTDLAHVWDYAYLAGIFKVRRCRYCGAEKRERVG